MYRYNQFVNFSYIFLDIGLARWNETAIRWNITWSTRFYNTYLPRIDRVEVDIAPVLYLYNNTYFVFGFATRITSIYGTSRHIYTTDILYDVIKIRPDNVTESLTRMYNWYAWVGFGVQWLNPRVLFIYEAFTAPPAIYNDTLTEVNFTICNPVAKSIFFNPEKARAIYNLNPALLPVPGAPGVPGGVDPRFYHLMRFTPYFIFPFLLAFFAAKFNALDFVAVVAVILAYVILYVLLNDPRALLLMVVGAILALHVKGWL